MNIFPDLSSLSIGRFVTAGCNGTVIEESRQGWGKKI